MKLENSISAIRRSLEFLDPRVEDSGGAPPSEVVQELNTGYLAMVGLEG